MLHIESRRSRRRSSEVEIFVDCECGKTEFNELIQLLKFQTTIVTLNPPDNIWTEEEGKGGSFFSLYWVILEYDRCSKGELILSNLPCFQQN